MTKESKYLFLSIGTQLLVLLCMLLYLNRKTYPGPLALGIVLLIVALLDILFIVLTVRKMRNAKSIISGITFFICTISLIAVGYLLLMWFVIYTA